MPRVNPKILSWARETAALSLDEAADKLQIRAVKGASAVDRLAALEVGDELPTRPMLVRMAKQYRRSLLTFYLSAPPRLGDRGKDFRTLPKDYSEADRALIDALIRDVRARQSMVRAVLENEDEATILPFVGSKNMSDGLPDVLSSIRNTIQVSLPDFRAQPSPPDAFALLRSAAEQAGVFVLLMGNLGSHHTTIDLETFRGFVLADDVAPFVVINPEDSKAAWSFTLIHELTHLWLGQTGVSGASAGIAIEKFCNDVAGEYLMPSAELDAIRLENATNVQMAASWISQFARERNLSSSMVAYRLYRAGAISQATWRNLSATFRDLWRKDRYRQREQARNKNGGPNFYVVRRHRLGNGLSSFVERMVSAGAITTCKAGKVLGVKAKQVQALLEATQHRRARRL